jgi:hypothetical protein
LDEPISESGRRLKQSYSLVARNDGNDPENDPKQTLASKAGPYAICRGNRVHVHTPRGHKRAAMVMAGQRRRIGFLQEKPNVEVFPAGETTGRGSPQPVPGRLPMATANLIAKSAAVVVTALIVGTVIPLAVVLLMMAVAPWAAR